MEPDPQTAPLQPRHHMILLRQVDIFL